MEAAVLEREFMNYPDIEQAERCWKKAALALRGAQAAHIASATEATAGRVAQAELAVEKCEANWEAAIMQHGIPDDGIQFNVATQFLFRTDQNRTAPDGQGTGARSWLAARPGLMKGLSCQHVERFLPEDGSSLQVDHEHPHCLLGRGAARNAEAEARRQIRAHSHERDHHSSTIALLERLEIGADKEAATARQRPVNRFGGLGLSRGNAGHHADEEQG